MSINPKHARRLVTAAERFHALRLWEAIEADETVMLAMPGEEHPCAVCIMGQRREQFGFSLFPGGLPDLARMRWEGRPALDEIHQIALTVDPLREIPKELRAVLEAARWRGRRETLAPCCLVKPPGRPTRSPRNREVRLLLYALSALVETHEAGTLAPRLFHDPEGVPLLTLSGKPHAPDVAMGTHPPLPPSEVRAALELELPAGAEATAGTWCVGLFDLPLRVVGAKRPTRALIVLDGEDMAALHSDVLDRDDLEGAARSLTDFAKRASTLPERVLFAHRPLHRLAGPAFDARGIASEYEPNQPDLATIGENVTARAAAERRLEAPSDDEWQAWHEACHAVGEATGEHADASVIRLAFRQYFGSEARAKRIMDGPDGEFVASVFGGWLNFCYRPRRGGSTLLERVLGTRQLTGRALAVAEAIRDARAALLLVEDAHPPLLFLRDVFSDELHEVTDHGLSGSAPPGLLVPALVYPAGPFTFVTLIGDFVHRVDATDAFDMLEEQGIPVTAEGLAEHSYFGGRIAVWKAARRERPPRRLKMVNFDGDPILMHTAEFSMRDPDAVARHFDEREDIDFDEGQGLWVWERETGSGRTKDGAPEVVLLGRLEMDGDRLVLEVNSEQRFEAASAWLEDLPGVELRDVQTRELEPGLPPRDDLPPLDEADEEADDGEFDDRPPEDESEPSGRLDEAAVLERLVDFHASNLRRWPDASVPALGGKTPREACRTNEGRRKVDFMLRIWHKPSDLIPEHRHRTLIAEVRADLGLS